MNSISPSPLVRNQQLVVNLFGGPCAGKSSLAAILFGRLKREHYEAELAVEFAKDLAFENRRDALKCQIYVLGNQYWRIQRAFSGGAQIVVTDSPCLLSCAYQTSPGIEAAALEAHFAYPSLNLFVDRSVRYSAYGRVHERDQAEQIDERIIGILNRFSIPFTRVSIEHGEQQAVAMVLEQARRAAEAIEVEPLSSFDHDNAPLPC
ncbi:ATP-binding protein (plasmid) [Acidiphilium multivorum]|uniref:ATP/GTP-binding protein n=1 Tax=Acidiphilium multivorum TaxID=62140 RepID=UPI001F4BD854|nr:ATP-binding protein [Acidiphilium multivorum]UNC16448.1 ATP-binding protein [Acidiphilium multivorum]